MHVVVSPCNISHNIIYRMVKRMKPGAFVWQYAMRLHLHRERASFKVQLHVSSEHTAMPLFRLGPG